HQRGLQGGHPPAQRPRLAARTALRRAHHGGHGGPEGGRFRGRRGGRARLAVVLSGLRRGGVRRWGPGAGEVVPGAVALPRLDEVARRWAAGGRAIGASAANGRARSPPPAPPDPGVTGRTAFPARRARPLDAVSPWLLQQGGKLPGALHRVVPVTVVHDHLGLPGLLGERVDLRDPLLKLLLRIVVPEPVGGSLRLRL